MVLNSQNQDDLLEKNYIKKIPVPALYKSCAAILNQYCNKEGSLKTLIYGKKIKNMINIKKLYALLCKTVDRLPDIKEALASVNLFEEQPKFDCYLAYVLTSELITKNEAIKGDCKPVQVINLYEEKLRKKLDIKSLNLEIKPKQVASQTYVRINTLLSSCIKVHKTLNELGWKILPYDKSKITYDKFLSIIQDLDDKTYVTDYHIDNLLVFSSKQEFWKTELFRNRHIILQDKASCLPAYVSGAVPGDSVIDACAAPGNKTSHLAQMMNNDGKLIAVDRDTRRFVTMESLLTERGAINVVGRNCDFKTLDPQEFQDIKIIIVDPSCSSSGTSAHEDVVTEERLTRLSKFQYFILCHALSFPSVQTVVYSTCSVNECENEQIVEKALAKFRNFELEPMTRLLPGWKNVGSTNFNCGSSCLRAVREIDRCNGFFVAKFVRNKEGICKKKKKRGGMSKKETKKGEMSKKEAKNGEMSKEKGGMSVKDGIKCHMFNLENKSNKLQNQKSPKKRSKKKKGPKTKEEDRISKKDKKNSGVSMEESVGSEKGTKRKRDDEGKKNKKIKKSGIKGEDF